MLVHFIDESYVRLAAVGAFERHRERILSHIPYATVDHIGSTAIPGAITKGDLDIQVRVQPATFKDADRVLASMYERNIDSSRTDTFSSFLDDSEELPIGVQLTVVGSEFDDFLWFRDLMVSNAEYLKAYNRLKTSCEGLDMDEYRLRKSRFIGDLIRLRFA